MPILHKLAAPMLALSLALGFVVAVPAHASPAAPAVPLTASYIVQVDPSQPVLDLLAPLVASLGGRVDQVFSSAIRGGVVTLPVALAPVLRVLPGIRTVEPDAVVRATQAHPRWGLDRIDERYRPLDGSYAYKTTGTGVDAYVIDSGIRFAHAQFGGRAVSGYDAIDGGRADDCHGHGTHVAGILGGVTYGVAKQARLIAVRVLDCTGSGKDSGVIAGIDWAIRHHTTARPAVANLSLGGDPSQALDTAVANLVRDKVTVTLAAGNDSYNACSFSPSRVASAITVAASDINDAMASYSNAGNCVDLIAPGSDILSAGVSSNGSAVRMSGTSMASPHVAGAAARYLQTHRTATPAAVASYLASVSTKGQVSGTEEFCTLLILDCVPATPNKLLYLSPSA